MLSNILFISGIIFIALIIFLGIKRKRLSLYWCRLKFHFSSQRLYYRECKSVNNEKSSTGMLHKKISVIIKRGDITVDNLLNECGLNHNQIIHEISNEKYQIIVLEKQLWFVIEPSKIISNKDALNLQVLLEDFSKKTHSPLLLVKQDAVSCVDDNAENKDEAYEDQVKNVVKRLFLSSKLIKNTVYWYTGLDKVSGFQSFKACVTKLPNAIPSYIYNDQGALSLQLEQYCSSLYGKIAKHSFLGNAEQIDGANVFLKELQLALQPLIKQVGYFSQYQNKEHNNIVFLSLSSVNQVSPFTFLEYEKGRTSYLQIATMGLISIGAISFSSYLFNAYEQYKTWEQEISKSNSENLLSSNVVIPSNSNISNLKISYLYPHNVLIAPINNSLANEFVIQVLIPKIKEEKDLTKKAFLILLASVSDREVLLNDVNIIADYLGMNNQETGLKAFLSSNISVDQNQIPSVDSKFLSAINDVELSKKDLQFYQAYYLHLIKDGINDYQNFINFAVKYDLPVRINVLVNELLNQDDSAINASPRNTAFLEVLGKEQVSLNQYLISPRVLADIRSVSPLKDITLSTFIEETNLLIKDYRYEESLNDNVAKRSSLFLKAAIISYVATYTEYMMAHSIPVVNATAIQMDNSQIELLNIGSYHLQVPVAYTLSYYNTVQAQIEALNKIDSTLESLGIAGPVQHVAELRSYVNNSYLNQYVRTYENLISTMGEMNLSDQPANEIMQTYSLSDSQFYNTLQLIAKNTTFSQEAIKQNPKLSEINNRFAAFNKVVNDKKFIASYQLIINNMQSQYRASQNSNNELLHNMLTFVDVPNKSPLLKVEALLKENYLPEQYEDIFTLPVTQVLTSLRPYLYRYLVQSWRKNITPEIVAASAYYPFNPEATKNIDYAELSNTFSPIGSINQFIDTAYLPFLSKVDGQYKIKLIDNDTLPKDVQQIIAYINSYKSLSNELWDKDGQAKAVSMIITPVSIPEQSIYPDKNIYMGTSFLALNKDDVINLPQQQAPVKLKYNWGTQDKSANVGWLDGSGNVSSIMSATGDNALFSLLKSATNIQNGDTYYWKISDSDAEIGFKLQSPLFQFIKEVQKYDKV